MMDDKPQIDTSPEEVAMEAVIWRAMSDDASDIFSQVADLLDALSAKLVKTEKARDEARANCDAMVDEANKLSRELKAALAELAKLREVKAK